MRLSTVAKAIDAPWFGEDVLFTSITHDSRHVIPGALYVALPGERVDGHDFIESAKAAGAVAALVTRSIDADFPHIKVDNTARALMHMGTWLRDHINPKIVALTGSCGKTTTRALLESVFSQEAPTLATQGNYNTNIGVPLTLMRLLPEHRFAIIEMGANHKGEIAEMMTIAKPNTTMITNAAHAHVEGFGSLTGVAEAKGEIFEGLPENGVAIINNDDQFASYWKSLVSDRRIITFGVNTKSDVTATDIQFDKIGCPRFILHVGDEKVQVQLNLMGKHNVMNALAAAAAATAHGISIDKIKRGLEEANAVQGRLIATKGIHGCRLIDDSYNANPLSVKAAISVLSQQPGHSILVLGDMKELGTDADELHREIGDEARKAGLSKLYCYGDLTRYAAEAFGSGGYFFDDQDKLIDALKKAVDETSVVLIKGSYSTNMKRVVNALKDEGLCYSG